MTRYYIFCFEAISSVRNRRFIFSVFGKNTPLPTPSRTTNNSPASSSMIVESKGWRQAVERDIVEANRKKKGGYHMT